MQTSSSFSSEVQKLVEDYHVRLLQKDKQYNVLQQYVEKRFGTLEKELQTVKAVLEEAYTVIDQEIIRCISSHFRRFYSPFSLECEVLAPLNYVQKKISIGWISYTPKRKRVGYTLYYKTESLATFQATWYNVQMKKSFLVRDGKIEEYAIVISTSHPARLIYNSRSSKLVLTYKYFPTPLPENWIPSIRINNRKRNYLSLHKDNYQLYWQEK
jgi:hypothetical protein